MKDIITACILKAKKKGKLDKPELIKRYLRIKYNITLSNKSLVNRICFLELQKPYFSY
mgnify:CR=1 FL=1